MNPQCARCKKVVYPMEKLNCLDKSWHKACFNCETCHMKLTMQTYKGYDKLPYCKSHYPTTKFTAVADTPEQLRLKEQSNRQSNIQYQKQYREDKNQASNAVSDDMGKMRINESPAAPSPKAYQPQHQPQQGAAAPPLPPANPPSISRSVLPPPPPPEPEPEPEMAMPPPPPPAAAEPQQIPRFRALFDYDATDSDEVTFIAGDIFIDVVVVDDGWLEGTVERNGQSGMLPSNYVEKI